MIQLIIIYSIISIIASFFGFHDNVEHQLNTTLTPSYNLELQSIYMENKTHEIIQDPNLTDIQPVIFQTVGNNTSIAQYEGLNAYYFNPKATAYYLAFPTPISPFILDTVGTSSQSYNNLIVKYMDKKDISVNTYYPYQEFFLLNKTKLIEQSEQPKDMMIVPPIFYVYILVSNPIISYDCSELNSFIKANQQIKSNDYEIQAMNIFEIKCLQRNNEK